MAKKVVATLQKKDAQNFVRAIKMVKSDKTGAYTFKEKIIGKDKIKDFFNVV